MATTYQSLMDNAPWRRAARPRNDWDEPERPPLGARLKAFARAAVRGMPSGPRSTHPPHCEREFRK